MPDHRPAGILTSLGVVAALSFATAALLDENDDWGDARQTVANVAWIIFLLSVVALAVSGVRLLMHRRRAPSRSR